MKKLSFTSKIEHITADWETVLLPLDRFTKAEARGMFSDVAKVQVSFKNGISMTVKMESTEAHSLVQRARMGDEFEISIEPKPKKANRKKS